MLRILFIAIWTTLLGGFLAASSNADASVVPTVRVGLDVGRTVEIGADTDWLVGIHHSGTRPARVSSTRSWKLQAIDGAIVRVSDDEFVREIADTLFVYPDRNGSGSVRVGGRPYRGELLVFARDSQLFVVNVIDLESYLLGVVPLEIGSQNDARFEAVKAQAVAARSYTLSMLGRWKRDGFDLKDTVEDQAYGGRDVETARCTRAVEETRGVVATYDDKPILAYYSSTSGGHTAGASEVWERSDRPYLTGVRDKTSRVKHSFCDISPFYTWEEVWSITDFERLLDSNLAAHAPEWSRAKYGAFVDMQIRSRSESKRVSSLELQFQHGVVTLHGDEIRWAIRRPDGGGLRSTLLERVGVRRSGGRPVEVKVLGRGYGHGVGLCQYGAMGMSQEGYDYTQILRFYYRGAELRKYY